MKTAIWGLVLIGISGHAQPAPAFEVASVKPSPPRAGTARFTTMDADPALVRYSNIRLKLLIATAYRVDSRLIRGGSDWLDEEPYDVAAKLPPGASKKDVPAMLQTLLRERFKLAVHRETTEQRAYFLVAGKNGPRLKETQKTDAGSRNGQLGSILRDRIVGHDMSMAVLAAVLSRPAGYEVVDHTGMAGSFDIDLKWTPEGSEGTAPSLFTALQEQLGLKLEPGKAPVETLVIDHAERPAGED